MGYDVRSASLHPCEKDDPRPQYVVYQGSQGKMTYRKVECKSHSTECKGPNFLRMECKPVYTYIPALNKVVTSACECNAD